MSEIIKIINAKSTEGIEYLASLKERAEGVQADVMITVEKILSDIKKDGDKAVLEYTRKFDAPNLESLKVTEEEIKDAYTKVEQEFIDALNLAKENIWFFHEKQKNNSWMTNKDKGVVMGQVVRALDKVGIYVPGGTAAYPSSVLMNALPAKVAGVNKIVMTTPPSKDGSINPNILVAADIAVVDEIYKAGGAQAIGALAFGTESVPKVDKIVGPGNIFVALAKRSVFGFVDIDMIAGPSEILIIADEKGNEKFIAADLMSQAEHDKLASSILVTTSVELANKVQEELKRQVEYLSRKEIILTSLENYGAIIVVDTMEEAIEMANRIAPEHLELAVAEPFLYLGDIKNAGSIFLGHYAPEPLGDYMAGPNHVLPTSGTARFFSPLSVDDFVKKSSYIYYSEGALRDVKDQIVKLADTEGLTAHANSIKVRFE
ncbi:MAG: histidinol dehydrogenase [Bacillota bacterium]|nr:histidinol dehydrogenase [Bacillota bacterium]